MRNVRDFLNELAQEEYHQLGVRHPDEFLYENIIHNYPITKCTTILNTPLVVIRSYSGSGGRIFILQWEVRSLIKNAVYQFNFLDQCNDFLKRTKSQGFVDPLNVEVTRCYVPCANDDAYSLDDEFVCLLPNEIKVKKRIETK